MADAWADDRGTTLTEVLVVLAISALVVPSLYFAVVAGFRQEREQAAGHDAEQQLQFVAGLLRDDIRASWPSDIRSGSASDELSIEHLADDGSLMRTFWFLDGTSLIELVTEGDSGLVVSRLAMLEDMQTTGQMFRYWTADGGEITDGLNIAACAVRVTVLLRVAPEGADRETSFDASHRLRDPEAEAC